MAKLFGIGFARLPCLLLFHNISSPEHLVVSWKGMSAAQIAPKMRSVFSIVSKAVEDDMDPLKELQRKRKIRRLQKAGRAIISTLREWGGMTLTTAMEAVIRSALPS